MRPQFGNTLAVSLEGTTNLPSDLTSYLRVEFSLWDGKKLTKIEAVYCDELYAKQIENEGQDDDIDSNFSRVFKQDGETRLICPNLTTDIDFVKPDQTISNRTE